MKKEITTTTAPAIEAGAKFTFGGIDWIALEVAPDYVLSLAADVIEQRAFDTKEKNDFASSSLRAYLNGEFLKRLVKAGAPEAAFIPLNIDLTSDDGLKDYGTDTAKIGLISCEQYRRFRSIIPNASDWWWTCTPYSTERNGYARIVRYVSTDGTLLSNYAYHGSSGVRPLCCLKSEILVSAYDEEAKKRSDALDMMKHLAAAFDVKPEEVFSEGRE
ncbi:hypothetical protein UNSWDHB_2639 [Dehalobacter sp. UNSWDHB]|uniref:DUF6273 domain-containing protein n=1 Tax=Dehalobacter sp. UNSWDHB TaxID=1339256 RepID=UPI0003875F39|nr:DUF6273 domain-containing protein [Dehalobacter sp. UNSWDHB]EQB20053.1 hypothetical protein UNSWDHB_2639 [Dehalobacter sp. UNSWDHB]